MAVDIYPLKGFRETIFLEFSLKLFLVSVLFVLLVSHLVYRILEGYLEYRVS